MTKRGKIVGALDGMTILDFTQMMFGPFATQMLADAGARVIKVERLEGEWERGLPYEGRLLHGTSPFFWAMNRNKESLAIDLKQEPAREVVRRWVRRADVVVSNFRPGVMERLGLGYEQLVAIKPDIIAVEGSGWGADGPYSDRPGQDLLVQAMAGLAASGGRRDDPPTPAGSSVADAAGALHLALAILVAYVHRLRTGQGQRVRVNLLDSLIAIECQEAVAWLNLGGRLERSAVAPGSPWLDAPFGVYRVRDGYIALAMGDLGQLARALGAPQLDPGEGRAPFQDRDRLLQAIQDVLAERDLTVVDALLAHDIWCAKVQSLPEALADPQVHHNGMIWEVDHPRYGRLRLIGHPIHYERTPAAVRLLPPAPGEHTVPLLREVGYSREEIADLLRRGVVASAQGTAGREEADRA